jgi:DNA processing protein
VWEFVEAHAPLGVYEPAAHRRSSPAPDRVPEMEAAVLACVGFEPTEVGAPAGRSGIKMRTLLPALALLEHKGYAMRNPGGVFVRWSAPRRSVRSAGCGRDT